MSAALAVGLTIALYVDRDRFGLAVRDVLAVARAGGPLPFYTAWFTYLGCVLWAASAALGLLAWRLLSRSGPSQLARLALGAAGLSALLGIDDLFMLHDGVLGDLGVPELAVTGAWGGLAALWVLLHRRELLGDDDLPLLGLTGVWLAHSVVSDAVGELVIHEEASKLAAVVCWAIWHWRLALRSTDAFAKAQSGRLTSTASGPRGMPLEPYRVTANEPRGAETSWGETAARRAGASTVP